MITNWLTPSQRQILQKATASLWNVFYDRSLWNTNNIQLKHSPLNLTKPNRKFKGRKNRSWFDYIVYSVLTSISRWKSNKSIFCQFDPSNARIFQYLLTYVCEIFNQHYLVISSMRIFDYVFVPVRICIMKSHPKMKKSSKVFREVDFLLFLCRLIRKMCAAQMENGKRKKKKPCLDEKQSF